MPDPLYGPASQEDEAISLRRERVFLGTFRVRLDNILLPALTNHEIRHAKRLEDIFKVQGCFRLDSRNRAEATIDTPTWEVVSNRGPMGPQRHRIPPELHIGMNEAVLCFSGKCRLAAAKGTLDGVDRWWPVILYRREGSEALVQYRNHHPSHEKSPSRGLNYLDARQYHRRNDENKGMQVLKNLTFPMERKVRRLWQYHPQLTRGLDQCLRWRSLWHQVHLGVLHKIIASKCNEVGRSAIARAWLRCQQEYLRYLDSVSSFWDAVSAGGRIYVSEEMVTALQGRCPTFSESDRMYLQSRVDSGHLMNHLNRDDKAHVLVESARYGLTIPSLFTFFEDHKYISLCSKTLRKLLGDEKLGREESLRTSFQGKFTFRYQTTVQTGRTSFATVRCGNKEDAFDWIYSQLWLCSMRLWAFVLEDNPRKREKGVPSTLKGIDGMPYLVELARTAKNLGLFSPTIDRLASGRSLTEGGEVELHNGFATHEGGSEYRLTDRCGIPFDDTIQKDLNTLYVNILLNTTNLAPGVDITLLFVRRAIFQRLFPESARLYASTSDAMRLTGINEPE